MEGLQHHSLIFSCYSIFFTGNQGVEGTAYWYTHQYGIQVFELSTDQICSLLQNQEPAKGEIAIYMRM